MVSEHCQCLPSFLHIVLGIVKKHGDLLEAACHGLDKQIAKEHAEEDKTYSGNIPLFKEYIMKLQKIRRMTQAMHQLEREYAFYQKSDELQKG